MSMTIDETTEQTAPEPRKRGRPKGSRNKQREIVLEIPPACPKCGATDKSTSLPNPIIRDYVAGTVPNHPEVTRVTWRRMRCQCGNHWVKQTFDK